MNGNEFTKNIMETIQKKIVMQDFAHETVVAATRLLVLQYIGKKRATALNSTEEEVTEMIDKALLQVKENFDKDLANDDKELLELIKYVEDSIFDTSKMQIKVIGI